MLVYYKLEVNRNADLGNEDSTEKQEEKQVYVHCGYKNICPKSIDLTLYFSHVDHDKQNLSVAKSIDAIIPPMENPGSFDQYFHQSRFYINSDKIAYNIWVRQFERSHGVFESNLLKWKILSSYCST